MPDPKDIVISKEILSELPPDYEETSLGDSRGAKKQYRSHSSGIHVREYDDKFTIHIDRADPRSNLIGHLIKDSPETIAAAATTLYFAKRSLGKRNAKITHDSAFLGIGLLSSLFASFLTFNAVFRFLKTALFG